MIFAVMQVFIDGPFGTPTREIFETEHVVLIASGIGVTPFASILQSIMFRHTASKVTCPHCKQHWYRTMNENGMKLNQVKTRVHFNALNTLSYYTIFGLIIFCRQQLW